MLFGVTRNCSEKMSGVWENACIHWCCDSGFRSVYDASLSDWSGNRWRLLSNLTGVHVDLSGNDGWKNNTDSCSGGPIHNIISLFFLWYVSHSLGIRIIHKAASEFFLGRLWLGARVTLGLEDSADTIIHRHFWSLIGGGLSDLDVLWHNADGWCETLGKVLLVLSGGLWCWRSHVSVFKVYY